MAKPGHDVYMSESGLTREKAAEFQQLIRATCGAELALDEAATRATEFIALYRMLMGPIPEDSGVRAFANLPSRPVETERVLE